jgi:hypothetical protein
VQIDQHPDTTTRVTPGVRTGMMRWLLAATCVILPTELCAQTLETLKPGQPFSVQADHADAIDPTTGQVVPVDGYRLRRNGTIFLTLPFSARDPQGHVTFAVPAGWTAGVYDILVSAYNVIKGVTNEAPSYSAPAQIRLTVGTPPPPPPESQCADGLDNDKDGLIDLADPGCASATDTDETNTTPPPPPATGCGWTVTPTPLTVPAAGGSFNGTLTAASTCAWSVYSTSAWLTVGSPTKGKGSGTIPFTVTANTSTVARAGNVIVVDAATGSMATNIAVHQEAGGGAPPPPPP